MLTTIFSAIGGFFSSFRAYLIMGVVVVLVALGGYALHEADQAKINTLTAQTASLTAANNDAQATIKRLQADAATVSIDTSTATTSMAQAASQEAAESVVIESARVIPGKPDNSLSGLLAGLGEAGK